MYLCTAEQGGSIPPSCLPESIHPIIPAVVEDDRPNTERDEHDIVTGQEVKFTVGVAYPTPSCMDGLTLFTIGLLEELKKI